MAAATTGDVGAFDDGAEPDPKPARDPGPGAPKHARRPRAHHLLRLVGLVTTGALTFVLVGATAAYLDIRSQITIDDVDGLLGDDRPAIVPPVAVPTKDPDPSDPYAGAPINLLVMGTDLRDAANIKVAGGAVQDGMRSDTTLLVHVAADRTRAEIVSIPRDSLVDIPSCTRPDGSTTYAQSGAMFNTAFTLGGGPEESIAGAAACTRRTVEQLTGVRTTDHIVVKMNGVEPIVNALGGVTMCLPEAMHGREVDLDLPAGKQTLDGYEAINFLRARKGTGFGLELGSDLQRIERQQAFLDATVHEITSKSLLTDAPTLYKVIKEVLGSISTSKALGSPQALAGLAFSLRDIPADRVVFTSLPVVTAPTDINRVVWTSGADAIWARIAADEAPPGLAGEPGTSASGSPTSGGSDTTATPKPHKTAKATPTETVQPGVCG